ncbi:hypothetical protein CRG98_022555 [Punica granatum]|uniref:Uncharacterized protein n=1 Tax=Punica granatum TaxID=22663 RepID=A0A2I0JLA5_PUNGR|nr:hypothetical protein CRG98_022555 [Punica granatum]
MENDANPLFPSLPSFRKGKKKNRRKRKKTLKATLLEHPTPHYLDREAVAILSFLVAFDLGGSPPLPFPLPPLFLLLLNCNEGLWGHRCRQLHCHGSRWLIPSPMGDGLGSLHGRSLSRPHFPHL